ncbi:MAG: HugZ family protein [Parvibaculum sp.]|nr:HugZ family protein [Parvibaculum sp.]
MRLDTNDEARGLAETLLRTCCYGALAWAEPGTGQPLISRVGCAPDIDATIFFPASALSAHTKALARDARCSLLIGEPGKGDPLAYPRLSLAARVARVGKDGDAYAGLRRRYLARHPKAGIYLDLPDFAFYRLDCERAFLNGGFGKAFDLAAGDMFLPRDELAAELAKAEEGIVSHMNEDHAEAVGLYATVLAKAGPGHWRIVSLDPRGLDLAAGQRLIRLNFAKPLASAAEIRPVLVEMAKEARAMQAG